MASYATIPDLVRELSETKVAQLGHDGSGAVSISDAGTVAVLNRAIEDASNEVRGALIGRVDFEDAQTLADCRRYAVTLALYRLFIRRNHYGPANPYNDSARAVRAELKAIRAGDHNTGTTSTPASLAVSITEDKTPVFNDNEDGDTPSFMSRW
jgi:phage gp36-like protein